MRLAYWRILLVVWMAGIYLGSSALFVSRFSADATVEVFGLLNYAVRKLAHMTEYGILMFLWFRSIDVPQERLRTRLILSILLAIGYAATDEYHQSFVPERLGIWTDVLWDAAGATAVGCLLWWANRSGPRWARDRLLGKK